MREPNTSRRLFLSSTFAAMPALILGNRTSAQTIASANSDAFQFEVVRSESEWKALLSNEEYKILRQGATEVPRSDPQWNSTEAGRYSCKGCDLDIYDARWKVVLDMGWLFFRHSQQNAVLTSIDQSIYNRFRGPSAETESAVIPDTRPVERLTPEEQAVIDALTAIEVHCRRCGSHFGHIIWVDEKLLHCVNGASFHFKGEEKDR